MTEFIEARIIVTVITEEPFEWHDLKDLLVLEHNADCVLETEDDGTKPLTMHEIVQKLDYPEIYFGFNLCNFCGITCHEESDGTIPKVEDCTRCNETVCSKCYLKVGNEVLCPDCFEKAGLTGFESTEVLVDLIAGDESNGVYHAIMAELEGF